MPITSDIPNSAEEILSQQFHAPSRSADIVGKLLLLIVSILMCIGIIIVYSGGAGWAMKKFSSTEYFLWRHLLFSMLGIAVIGFVGRLDYHVFQKTSKILLLASIALLMLLLMMKAVHLISGAARWLGFGPFRFQVSDLAKYAVIFHLSRLITEKGEYITDLWDSYLPMLANLLVVVFLVALAPNFSTASLIGIIGFILMFIGGVSIRHIFMTALPLLPLALAFALAAPYRVARLISFFSGDEKAMSYQVVQALIGLGNGGLDGRGIGNSMQRDLFLPLSYNDFVFVIVGEEYGFFGAVAVTALFAGFLVCGIIIAKHAPDGFGRYVAAGIAIAITFFAFINIAVACSLLPTTGVALPFMSYGGSAMIFNSLGVGILLSISGYRKRQLRKAEQLSSETQLLKITPPNDV
ncbi:MAG: cell division protein FtsW [Chlorobiaceae bacterium]|nr:cell division protein FtsW [Chlorobiaceae bacterium]